MSAMWLKWALVLAFGVMLAGGGTAALAAYDGARRDVIAPGVRVAGIPVGGLHADAARARVAQALRTPLSRPVVVRARGRKFKLPAARAGERVDVDGLVAHAVALSRRGSVIDRTVNELTGARVEADLPARATFSHAAVERLVHRVAAAVDRPARDAGVQPGAQGLRVQQSHNGARLAAARLRGAVTAALARPRAARIVRARVETVEPRTSTKALARRYPSYIIVDRAGFALRLYRHLKLWKTYQIAVGMQGLETPGGLYDIQWKQTNPSWYVPNSAWAGSLAGKVIPPGPDDPIKARWMAFNGGAGIHGIDPSEYGSIGHNASHGCVRMRIPDVIEVYAHAPVHTPVFVA
jgi:lipoprotein-anchoring transpeptidase ErfK/SrfK